MRTSETWSTVSESSWHFEWLFAKGDPVFDGHFPQQSLLPGVFLMEMAERAAQFALEQSGSSGCRLVRVERFRFAKAIVPGDRCGLTLHIAGQPLAASGLVRIRAAFDSAGSNVAKGTLVMTAGPRS
ncbi:hypothetical protein [Paraburkholderia dilworthii]|uniref:hypothetical protein n=1 Tax=Paraburkholderia dilworthii TaxID=948106 RepID=UPI001376C899|nr:hypothetical protein [Paraburkholderia dilworthii]